MTSYCVYAKSLVYANKTQDLINSRSAWDFHNSVHSQPKYIMDSNGCAEHVTLIVQLHLIFASFIPFK